MLTDEQKDGYLQIINNLKERVTQMAFKLEDNENVVGEEWNYYNDQFIKVHLLLKRLEDAVYGS